MTGSFAVEAEHELIEIGLQMLSCQAVIDAECPDLEVGKHPVDPGQDHMGGHRADDMRVMADAGDAGIAGPAVGLGAGAGAEIVMHECVQSGSRKVLDPGQPEAAAPTFGIDLDRAGDQQLALMAAALTAAALVHELIEARDEKHLLRFQKQLAKYQLLIIDELGFVPLSKTGAELLFEVFSQRYERGSTLVTSNLPFDEWTEIFGSERLTGALLDRLTHHVHILEMNGDSYRLNQSRSRKKAKAG